jgi:hypothetical protein
MSKKRGKPAPKKALNNKRGSVGRRPVRGSAAKTTADTTEAAGGRTVQATIFIYRTGTGNKIRTSPQRMYANPGDRIEWSVVNLVDGSDVPVTITWPDASPFGKEPISFRGSDRKPLNGAASGRYKYVVSALDTKEDPEIEIPDV